MYKRHLSENKNKYQELKELFETLKKLFNKNPLDYKIKINSKSFS